MIDLPASAEDMEVPVNTEQLANMIRHITGREEAVELLFREYCLMGECPFLHRFLRNGR